MIQSPSIDTNIVTGRKQYAQNLATIIASVEQCQSALDTLKLAADVIDGPKQPLLNAIAKSKDRLNNLWERTRVRHERFASGLISVAVGGIEKSGKTTLLKTLTGIENLPTANERCTAVCCEIVYDGRNTFDLEFHGDEEFCRNVLHPLIEAFNKSSSGTSGVDAGQKIALPKKLSDFGALVLPSKGRFPAGTDSWIKLDELTNLQTHLPELREYVGAVPRRGIPLDKLSDWVAHHDDGKARSRVATVSRCVIFTPFRGGSENLRWIDTPGVDDPSPLARERTLKTVAQDADLLVVATMPRDKPSPTESFINFWTSIHNLRDEVDLMQRLLILLNWKKDADPQKIDINKHRALLENQQQVSPNLFCGPLAANEPGDVQAFMGEVNRHLAAHLPGQDAKVVGTLENELKSCLAEIRTSVFDVASHLSPADSGQSDLENNLFWEWFDHAASSGRQTGFWPELRGLFVKAVEEVPHSVEVNKAQSDLDAIFQQHAGEIGKSLPNSQDMNAMLQRTGNPPITSYMQTFSTGGFSTLINDLAKQVGDFGPIMQQAILRVFRESGLGPLLEDEEPQTALKHLLNLLSSRTAQVSESPNPVLEALRELAGLKQSLQYVYRWEMRPAINFLSPLQWNQGTAVDDLARLLEQGKGKQLLPSELRKYFKDHPTIPGIQDSPETHAEAFKQICRFALLGVKSVLEGGRCRLDNIADDFVRDFQTRLAFAEVSQQAWRNLLSPCRGELLGSRIAAIRANSDKLRNFRAAVEALGNVLP